MTIITRAQKGSPLTHAELDGNFIDLAERTNVAWAMDGLEPTVREGAGNPAELIVFRDNVTAYAYAPNSLSESYTNWDVPFNWEPGSDLYLALHWSPGNSTAVGTVRWGIEYTWAAIGSAFGESVVEYYEASTTGSAYQHIQTVSTPFPGEDAAQNMRFLIRIFRDGANANDTFPADAFLIGVDFYYQVSSFGVPSFLPPYPS